MRMRRLTFLLLIALAGCRAQQVEVSRLHVPAGFRIAIVAQTGSCGPRFMAWSPAGTLLATCVDEGKVLALPGAAQGSATRVVETLNDSTGCTASPFMTASSTWPRPTSLSPTTGMTRR